MRPNCWLTRLHQLQRIELLLRNRVPLLTARTIAWRKNRPVRRRYAQQVRQEFLDMNFDRTGSVLRFETAELPESSLKILARKIHKLVKEFDELVELGMSLPLEEKQSVGLLLAARPWVFSLLAD